jgi:DNA-binding CsgD family transcriptional regulator
MKNAAEVLSPFEDQFLPMAWPEAKNDAQRSTIRFFEEKQLTFDSKKKDLPSYSRIASELIAAATPEARMANIRSMLSMLGFASLQYEAVQHTADGIREHYFLKTYVPQAWSQRYAAKRYWDMDPRVNACLTSPFPFVWDLPYFSKAHLLPSHDPKSREFLQDMAGSGMCSGVAFGFVNPASQQQFMVALNADHASSNWLNSNTIGQALILGLSVHEFISGCLDKLMLRREPEKVSDIQKKILECLANGFSDKEIARNLNTTFHNVDYHLRHLRKKYGASNRAQLAYLIGRLSIV